MSKTNKVSDEQIRELSKWASMNDHDLFRVTAIALRSSSKRTRAEARAHCVEILSAGFCEKCGAPKTGSSEALCCCDGV